MIKVLHIFGQLAAGGAELRTLELLPLLSRNGVACDFCAVGASSGPLSERFQRQGGKILHCPLKPSLLRFSIRFVKMLRRERYDIVHSHLHYFSGWILFLAYLAGIQGRIAHFRSTHDGRGDGLNRKIYSKWMKLLITYFATEILGVSQSALALAWRRDWQTDARCRVIYNGIGRHRPADPEHFRKMLLQRLDIPENAFVVINVANLHAQKGHRVLLRAAKKLIEQNQAVYFILVGDGRERSDLEHFADLQGLNANIRFLGYRDDVRDLLCAADLFVLPSFREGLPGALLEALATGLPVIASKLPAVEEIARYTDVLKTVPVGDDAALAEAICRSIRDDTAAGAERGSRLPQAFELETCAALLARIYSQNAAHARHGAVDRAGLAPRRV